MSLANFAFVFLFFIPTRITKNLILTRINKNNKEYLITLMVSVTTRLSSHTFERVGWFNGLHIFLSTAKISIPLWNINGIPCRSWIHLYIYILWLYFWIRWSSFPRNTSWRVYTRYERRFHGTKGKIFPSWLTFRGRLRSQARIGEYSCSPLWNVRGNATHETQIHCSWHSRISLPSSLFSPLSLSLQRWTLKAVTTGWERHR